MSCNSSHFFPRDLWPNVLARLPVKTILKFRCVCRTFCSIIDAPDFASQQLKLCKTNQLSIHLLVLERPFKWDSKGCVLRKSDTFRKTKELEFESHILSHYFEIEQGFVNGLVLMHMVQSGKVKRKLGQMIVLWNPSIRKHVQIHTPPQMSTLDNIEFELCLGFDPLSNNHKVFVISYPSSFPNDPLKMYIYNHNNNIGWTNKTFDEFNLYGSREKEYLNGFIYMTSHEHLDRIFPIRPDFDTHLIAINVANETLSSSFGLPKVKYLDNIVGRTLTHMGESLALFDHGLVHSTIWVMGKVDIDINEGMFWSKRYEFDLSIDSYIFVGDKGLVLYEGEEEGQGVFSYNIETNETKHVAKNDALRDLYYVGIYEESLVLFREPIAPLA